MPVVSVIIPIYNAASTLQESVDSVRRQSLKDIEIICVDDGSQDESYGLLKKIASEDYRVKLIRHQKNLGAGGARNTGIRVARSPYITGVDSDDLLEEGALEKAHNEMISQAVDVVSYGFHRIDEQGEVISTVLPKRRVKLNSGRDFNIFKGGPIFWNRLWQRRVFVDNNVWFPENIAHEDVATIPRALFFCKGISYLPEALYRYRRRAGSLSNSSTRMSAMDLFRAHEILIKFLLENNIYRQLRKDFFKRADANAANFANIVLDSSLPSDEIESLLRTHHILHGGLRRLELFGPRNVALNNFRKSSI